MKKIIYLLFAFLLAAACSDDHVFNESPTERSNKAISALWKTLSSAPYGWEVIYFPRTDSLLYSNPSDKIGQFDYESEYWGYGGRTYWMDFDSTGIVQMLSDTAPVAASDLKKSEFSLEQALSIQLTFSTYNYVHQLCNEDYRGASNWMYWYLDNDSCLIFRTGRFLLPAKEYIRFRQLPSAAARDTLMSSAVRNRLFYEQMVNPQINIHQGGKIFFRSDYLKLNRRPDLRSTGLKNRYALYLFERTINYIPGKYPLEVNGLGSGYTGTPEGLTFQTGFRYNKDYIFHDFQRQGNKFVCELVRYYNPLWQQWQYVSKHLHPEGEPTGIVAEIADQGKL